MIVAVKKNGSRTFKVLELWARGKDTWLPMGTHRNLSKYIGVVFHGYGRGGRFNMWEDRRNGIQTDEILSSFAVSPGEIIDFPDETTRCLPPKGEADAYVVVDRASDLFCLTEPF